MKHKYKREFKVCDWKNFYDLIQGAIREMRKDNQFLAKNQLKEILENDIERARKVKELFDIISQERNSLTLDNQSEDESDDNN